MKNQLKAGVVLSYITTAVSIVIQLVYMPVMIRLLGQSEYGLYSLVSSVVSYLSLFSLGFSGAYIRFFAMSYGDRKKTASLNGMFITLFSVLAAVAAICGIILSFFPKQIFGDKLSADELSRAQVLMLILVISIAVSLVNGLFGAIISAHEQFIFQRILGLISTVISPFVTLPLLLIGYRSVMVVTVTTVIAFSQLLVNIWFCVCKIKIPVSFKGFEWKLLKEISLFSSFIFINMIIEQVNWNVDKLILGHTNGTEEVAVYGVASQINSLFMTFSTTISSVFTPRVNHIAAQKGSACTSDYTNLMAKIGRIQWMILGLPTLGFIVFGKYFIVNIYAGEGYGDAYAAVLFLVLPAIIPLIQNIGIEMQRALNKHQFRSIIYLIMATLNVSISIPLASRFGTVGTAMGTAFSLIIGNGIIMNIFYHRALKINMKYFWKEIFKTLKGIAIPIMTAILFMRFVHFESMVVYFVSIFAFSVVYCVSVIALSCNREEKNMLLGIIGKLKR